MIADPNAIQAQPLPNGMPPGIVGSDEILGHVDRAFQSLPPVAQAAVSHAHGILGLEPPANAVANPPESPATPSIASSPSIPPATPPVASGGDSAVPGMVGVNAGMLAAPPMPSSSVQALPNPPTQSSVSGNGEIADMDRANPNPAPVALPADNRSSASTELQRMRDTGSGVSQIHDPFLKTLGTIGDVIGSGLFPGLTQFIPGSSAHHQMLVGNKEAEVADEQAGVKSAADVAHTGAQTELEKAQTAGLPAESALKAAETQNYLSEADARKNPDLQVVAHPVIDPRDESKTPRTGYFNKKTGTMTYGPAVAAAPVAESNKPSVEKMDNGDIVAVHYDPTTKKSSMEVVYHGDPKIETDITKLEVNGKPHSVVVNKKTGATIKDLGETGEKPPTVNVNQGTWSIQEDADGRPIEYNSKTGETRAVAAGGVQKAGTKEKKDAATEKLVGPSRDALQYANDYAKKPATGPGDEALMEKFFELAKPSSGFRMTQSQIDMLKHAQSWMSGATAYIHHATTGTWFSDDLRKQIVGTMQDLANAKMAHLEGSKLHGAEELHGGASGAGDSVSHKVGDIKTFPNGKKGKWDGQGWEPQ